MPDVGKWAEYQGTMNQKPYTVRYAVIGAEEREGKPMKWLEFRMVGEDASRNLVYQILTPGNVVEMDQAQEVIFKSGDKPATRMNGMMLKMIRGQLKKNSVFGDVCQGVSVAGEESVTIPAGTFKAVRYHNSKYEGDTWMVPDLPFYMVKTKGKNIELSRTASGDGAKSSITEPPQEMPGFGPTK
jgi:hypothetical protein